MFELKTTKVFERTQLFVTLNENSANNFVFINGNKAPSFRFYKLFPIDKSV